MRTTAFILGIVLGLVLSSSVCTVAQTEESSPKVEVQGDVRYMSGGVGVEQRTAMESKAKEFNLKLVLAKSSRDYLSDLPVVIKDASGKTVLATQPEGPWLLVKLPPGEYTVEASMGNDKKVSRVIVGKGLKTLNILWK